VEGSQQIQTILVLFLYLRLGLTSRNCQLFCTSALLVVYCTSTSTNRGPAALGCAQPWQSQSSSASKAGTGAASLGGGAGRSSSQEGREGLGLALLVTVGETRNAGTGRKTLSGAGTGISF